MASRILITGVQLGMIKGMAKIEANSEMSQKIIEVIDEIMKTQYVGNSTNDIEKDVYDACTTLGFEV